MRTCAIVLVSLFAGVHFQAMGQSMKIGVVQSEYILAQLPETKAAQQDIAAFEKKLNNKILAMRQGLELQVANFQQTSASLSDSVRAEREQELQALQEDIAREQQTAQQQLQFKIMQSLTPLRQKVQQTIDSVAQVHAYTHIFPSNVDNQSLFLYVKNPEEVNITPLVIEALGLPAAPSDSTGQ